MQERGYSVILHVYLRPPGNMDIGVDRTAGNYSKLLKIFL